jgi:hypothetical protein
LIGFNLEYTFRKTAQNELKMQKTALFTYSPNPYPQRVTATNSQHPFGMLMDGRSLSSAAYRYGFGGQEKDDEINSIGNIYTAQFWEYDCRLGRRWNIDPLFSKYA